MEIGQNGVHGHHAVQLAEKERRQGLYTTFVFSINSFRKTLGATSIVKIGEVRLSDEIGGGG